MANPNIKRAVRVALIAAGTGSAAMYGAVSVAQEAELEQVIVTGSRIPQPNLEGTSPVSLISNADIKVQGTQQVEDLVNNMPQVFAGQGGNYSNGATGTATVNLRGLGSARTKVLINGRGMVAGSPRVGGEAPDLNQIPAPLIERVEVLTGGASAVYGSDAVAGVVNFIMKDNFEGVQFDGNYSFYNHDNGNDRMQGYVDAAGYAKAPGTAGSDGDSYEISMLMGSNFADDRGNATFFVGYRETDPLLQSERDYSACSLNSSSTGCGGSGTSFPGNIYDFDFNLYGIDPTTYGPSTTTNIYNFGPVNYWQRPDERWTASAFIHYDLTDSARVYSEFMFHDDRTVSQIAPSGAFGVPAPVPCDGSNPLVSAEWLATLCADPEWIDEDGLTQIYLLRRNVEGGGRQDDIRHTSYRGVVGVKGDVMENWNYDVSASYSQVIFSETYLNDFSITRTQRALDVIADDDGNPVCRSVVNGIDPACIPYNIWTPGAVTPEALAYLQIPLFSKGETELRTVTATMSSDLGAYGIQLPTASDGIGVAFGAEYREQFLDFQVDPNFESGDGAGQGGPTIGQSGGYNSTDLFAEVRVPLVQGMTMIDSLLLNASYRYSDYSDPINEKTNTYGVGLEWAPIQDIKLRGSFQRAVRAPSIIELFQAQGLGLYDNDADPCAGAVPLATLEQCQRTGVTADRYGSIVDNPAGQYNALFGGNTELDPETSDSYTVGFVLQPSFAPGLSLTVDYFDIKVEDVISTISPTIVLSQCLETGGLCDLIQRDGGQTLWLTPAAQIEATNLNIGMLQTSGFDLDVRYSTDVGSMGTLGFSLVGTLLDELVTEPIAGAGSIGDYDCAGLYGSDCGTPNPEWRHTARVTWGTPWNVDLTLGWRYFDEVMIDNADKNPILAGTYNQPDKTLDAQNYIDLAASFSFMESYEVRLGINNVMDDDPPISAVVGAGAGNGNTYPQVYDALGRYVFMGVSAKF